MILEPNGVVGTPAMGNLPDGADTTFAGTLKWGQSGPQFLLAQNASVSRHLIYVGTIDATGTTISGTRHESGRAEGTFTATYVP